MQLQDEKEKVAHLEEKLTQERARKMVFIFSVISICLF